MRPPKVILCIDSDEKALGVLAYLLSTNGYRVWKAGTAQEAAEIFANTSIDLVLCQYLLAGHCNGEQLILQLKTIARHVPMILMGHLDYPQGADLQIAPKTSPADLLARIRIMAARKRGPRKGSTRIPPASVSTPPALAVAAS